MPRRKLVDHTRPLWIEEGEPTEATLVSVAPVAPIDKLYTFTVDDALVDRIHPGQRVVVPFGKRGTPAPAIVVSITRGPWNSTLKSIDHVLEEAGQLSDHLIELGRWISEYYCCPLGRVLGAMVPEAVRQKRGFLSVRHARLVATAETMQGVRLGKMQGRIVEPQFSQRLA